MQWSGGRQGCGGGRASASLVAGRVGRGRTKHRLHVRVPVAGVAVLEERAKEDGKGIGEKAGHRREWGAQQKSKGERCAMVGAETQNNAQRHQSTIRRERTFFLALCFLCRKPISVIFAFLASRLPHSRARIMRCPLSPHPTVHRGAVATRYQAAAHPPRPATQGLQDLWQA
jgi:hypothetical protein